MKLHRTTTTLIGLAAALGSLATARPAAAGGGQPTVINGYEPEIVNTIPYFGCFGETVDVRFEGWLRATEVIFPDGSRHVTVKTLETATWSQYDVNYTTQFQFLVSDTFAAGHAVSVSTNAIGSGDDGSRVRLHAVFHLTERPDGTLAVTVDDGRLVCD